LWYDADTQTARLRLPGWRQGLLVGKCDRITDPPYLSDDLMAAVAIVKDDAGKERVLELYCGFITTTQGADGKGATYAVTLEVLPFAAIRGGEVSFTIHAGKA